MNETALARREVSLAGPTVRVLVMPDPFSLRRLDYRVPVGWTIGRILEDLDLPGWKSALIAVDGVGVPEAWWPRVRPRADHLVTIRVVPRGGPNAGRKVGIAQLVLGVIITIVGIWFPVLLPLGIGLIIGGVIALVMPVPKVPKIKPLEGDQAVFAITGSRNQMNPFGAVPKLYGTHRIFPPFGALPYTEIVGNDQYLRELFVISTGPYDLSDFRIGETPIENFTGVEMEVRYGYPSDPPLALFSNQVVEDALSIELRDSLEHIRTTRSNAYEFSVDFVFPRGIVFFHDNKKDPYGARIIVSYRRVGEADWTFAETLDVRDSTSQPIRRGVRVVVAVADQYEVKVQQEGGAQYDDLNLFGAAVWSALRTVRYLDPLSDQVKAVGVARIALRIKATAQLNGVVDTFNCLATSLLRDWDTDTQTWILRATANPASVYRSVMQDVTVTARPVADSQLDLQALQAWHEENADAGRAFNYIVEQQTTVRQLLERVTAVGRATVGSIDGTFGVVRDVPQTVPVQAFSPRNSRDYLGAKMFRDLPHAIRAQYIDDQVWQAAERVVPDDGHAWDAGDGRGPLDAFGNPSTLPIATRLEAMQLFGVTSSDQAWKLARYHLAAMVLRPETHQFTTDLEHLVCTRGDLVSFSHDVPLLGASPGWGRLTAVSRISPETISVTVDEPMVMVTDGTRYGLRIRASDGVTYAGEVVAVAGPQSTLTFVTPLQSVIPDVGDLFQFGELGEETIDLLITRIEMLSDLAARLTGVDAAPAVHEADQGPIPPFDPHITISPTFTGEPPTPIIAAVQSDEAVLVRAADGSLETRILITLHWASGPWRPAAFVEVRWRVDGFDGDYEQLRAPVAGDSPTIVVAPVEDGITYQIRLRSLGDIGNTSPWVEFTHTVVGKTTPPPDVLTFLIEHAVLRWAYPNEPLDFWGFLLRRQQLDRRVWEDAQPMHEGVISQTTYDLVVRDVGQVTYLIKAVDVAGNESANAAIITTNYGDPVVENTVDTLDYEAAGFPGTIVNGSVVLGDLEAATATPFWPSSDAVPFWRPSDVDLFWGADFQEMTYIFSYAPPAALVPGAMILERTVTARSFSMEYRASGPDLFWPADDAALFWSTRG